jgi:hypothetical protein
MADNPKELSHMNSLISFVVLWILVMHVLIAKSSFPSLENKNLRLTKYSLTLLEIVKELDVQ